jgi:hypothetical protein
MIIYEYTPIKFDYEKAYHAAVRQTMSKRAYYRWRGKRKAARKAALRNPVITLYLKYHAEMVERMKVSIAKRLYYTGTGNSGLDLLAK